MKTTLSRLCLLGILLLSSLAWATPTQAASATCTARVTTISTAYGPTKTTGDIVQYADYQFKGRYDTGTLAGATFTGTQKATQNTRTAQVYSQGSYVITATTGTLTIHFTLWEDDNTGNLSGWFTSGQGTGTLTNAGWIGTFVGTFVRADAQGLPTYQSTFSGPCRNLN